MGLSQSTIDAINNSTSATRTQTNAASKVKGEDSENGIGSLSGTDFMTLLITQLKNQDPMDPQDPTQMMAQLSQLTSVQKLASIDEKIGNMISANTTPISSYLGSYIGLSTGNAHVQDGNGGLIKMNLEQDASDITLNVLSTDGSNTVVSSQDLGAATKGERFINVANLNLPNGDYKYQLVATSSGGSQFNPTFTFGGIATSAQLGSTNTLTVNGQQVAIADIKEISIPPTSSSGDSSDKATT